MDTAILEAAYELNSIERAPLEEMFTEICTMCYHIVDELWPPSLALREYLNDCGFVGEIMLCLTCIEDTDNWGLEHYPLGES